MSQRRIGRADLTISQLRDRLVSQGLRARHSAVVADFARYFELISAQYVLL